MVKLKIDWKYVPGIVVFAFGVLYAGQDSTKISQPAAKIVAPPSGEKTSASTATTTTTTTTVTTTATTPKSPLPATVTPPAAAPKKSNSKEELIDEEDFLLPEKGEVVPQKAPASVSAPIKKDSTTAAAASLDTSKHKPDSSQIAAQPASPVSPVTKTDVVPVVKRTIPVRIEDVRPINFARNLKDYKSPKLAMLLSLCIPGLGQVYIGKTSNYVKAGAYVLAEGAIIGLSAYFTHQGNVRMGQAKAIANDNYDVDKMKKYYDDLKTFIASTDTAPNDKMNEIFFDSALISFTKSYASGPTQTFYNTIGEKPYVQGWKDCEPALSTISTSSGIISGSGNYDYQVAPTDTTTMNPQGSYLINLVDKATGKPISDETYYGHSAKADLYNSIVSDANNHYYKNATNILFVCLINHIVSSVDALISAKVYNDELLGRQSFLEKISIEPASALSFTTITPGVALKVRF